jgi:regulator of sirC expression with transglutaminase-like and TPR domain
MDGRLTMSDLAAFAALVQHPDDQIDLAAAALALARIHGPVGNPARYLRLLDDFAAWLGVRVDPHGDPERAVRQLSHYLAVDQRFHGNTRNYADPLNSCLNVVLDRRTGIPITLSVVWLEVGWRLGLPLSGVGLPGHFLIKYAAEGTEIILDPFHGGVILGPEDCARRLQGVFGRAVPLEAHYLAAVTRKQILTRMLNNLKQIYTRIGDYPRLLATVEHLLALSPWSLDEIRDRGLIAARLGRLEPAIADLETYLRYSQEADDAALIHRRLEELRRRHGE